jgi:hypothetical protein
MARYEDHAGSVEVIYDDAEMVFVWQDAGQHERREVASFSPGAHLLRVFPKKRSGVSLVDQFSRIAELRLETGQSGWYRDEPILEGDRGLELQGLPDGFSRIFQFGLGLRRAYRGLLYSLEENTDCHVVQFGSQINEGPAGDVFHIRIDRFIRYKQAVDRNYDRGSTVVRRVNETEAHNAIADLFKLEPRKPTIGRHPVIQAMTREIIGEPTMDSEDRRLLVRLVSAESRTAAVESPGELGMLRRDIELVSLEVLIEQFAEDMEGSRAKDEAHWQKFFETNTFALQQLFATPVALYKSQLVVKGINATGRGSRIADFMLVNTVTRSALVVEIKTPAAELTGKRYRGTGGSEVFLPHRDLLGAVTQIQAQIHSATTHLPHLLAHTPGAAALDTLVVCRQNN